MLKSVLLIESDLRVFFLLAQAKFRYKLKLFRIFTRQACRSTKFLWIILNGRKMHTDRYTTFHRTNTKIFVWWNCALFNDFTKIWTQINWIKTIFIRIYTCNSYLLWYGVYVWCFIKIQLNIQVDKNIWAPNFRH